MSEPPDKPRLDVLGAFFDSIVAPGPPRLDDARAALGGPWSGDADVGLTVRVLGHATPRHGVVIAGGHGERDVWIGEGRIQRVRTHEVEVIDPDPKLAAVADDAVVHASLHVGQAVRYVRALARGSAGEGATHGEGTLAEKLRFGSLVGLPDGRVLAVSFRRIAPLDDGEPA